LATKQISSLRTEVQSLNVKKIPLTVSMTGLIPGSLVLGFRRTLSFAIKAQLGQRKTTMKLKRVGTRQSKMEAPPRLWHPEVPGPLWNGTRRVEFGQIEAYCRVVAREFHPRKIILFGSYANGSATPDSDVDLLIILPLQRLGTNKAVEIRGRVEAPFPLDLLVWERDRERKDDSFTRSILSGGKVLYEASRA
jgi:predicted nucleotidyltransferase